MFIKSLRAVLAAGMTLLGASGTFAQPAEAPLEGALARSGLEVDAAIRAYYSDEFLGAGVRNFDGARQTETQEVSATAPANMAMYVVRVVNQGQSTTPLRLHGTASGGGWMVSYYDRNGEDITRQVTSPEGWRTPELSAISTPENDCEIGIQVVADERGVDEAGADGPQALPLSEVLLSATSGIAGTRPDARYSDVVKAVTRWHNGDRLTATTSTFDATIRSVFQSSIGGGIHNRTGREQRCLQATVEATPTLFYAQVANTSSRPERYVVRCAAPPAKTRIAMGECYLNGKATTRIVEDPTIAARVLGEGWTSPLLAPGETLELSLSLQLDAGTPLGQLREAALSVARSDAPEDTDVVVAATGLQAVQQIQYSLDSGKTWQDAPLAGRGFIRVRRAELSTIGLRVFKAVPNLPWPEGADDAKPSWVTNMYFNVGEQIWVLPQGEFSEKSPYRIAANCGNQLGAELVLE